MKQTRRARLALAAALASTLILPSHVLADSKPAQPGTVRPADKTQAQPGTSIKDKVAVAEKKAAPAEKKEAAEADNPKPKLDARLELSEQAVIAPPKPAVAAATPKPTGSELSLATQATESTATPSVRESLAATASVVEAASVRDQHADDLAWQELEKLVQEDGDVRDDLMKDHQAVTRLGEDDSLNPVDAPTDDDPDEDDDDLAVATEKLFSEVTGGATLKTAGTAIASLEFGASQTGSTLVASQSDGGVETAHVSAAYDVAEGVVSVAAPQAEFAVEVPHIPASLEQAIPAEIMQAVDQSVAHAQQVIDAKIAERAGAGEHITDTAFGQVSTWLSTK